MSILGINQRFRETSNRLTDANHTLCYVEVRTERNDIRYVATTSPHILGDVYFEEVSCVSFEMRVPLNMDISEPRPKHQEFEYRQNF